MAATHQLKVQDIFSVKDYVCVVTGGGTGIGLMCCMFRLVGLLGQLFVMSSHHPGRSNLS